LCSGVWDCCHGEEKEYKMESGWHLMDMGGRIFIYTSKRAMVFFVSRCMRDVSFEV